MTFDLTKVILAVIALISAVLTYFVIPWIKSKINVENGKLSENQAALIKMAISTAVKAAEQLYNSEEGKQKKAYVLSVLGSQGYEVDSVAIDAAIEAAVLSLHQHLEP